MHKQHFRNSRGSNARTLRAVERRLNNKIACHAHGQAQEPTMNPTAFTQRPWNHWTYETNVITEAEFASTTVTVADIINQIRTRCAINPAAFGGVRNRMEIKILRSASWLTASTLVFPDLETTFFELTADQSNTLAPKQSIRKTLRDKGTLNTPAKTGFCWPARDQGDVLSDDDGNVKVLTNTGTATSSNITTRINVLWKCYNVAA